MKCDEAENLILLYAELSREELKRLEQHVLVCSSCAATMRDWQNHQRIVQETFPARKPDHPAILTSRVMASIAGQRSVEVSPLWSINPSGIFRSVMAVVSLTLIAFFFYEAGHEPTVEVAQAVPASEAVVLNTAAFMKSIVDRGPTVDPFFACVQKCRDEGNTKACESCLERLKNISL